MYFYVTSTWQGRGWHAGEHWRFSCLPEKIFKWIFRKNDFSARAFFLRTITETSVELKASLLARFSSSLSFLLRVLTGHLGGLDRHHKPGDLYFNCDQKQEANYPHCLSLLSFMFSVLISRVCPWIGVQMNSLSLAGLSGLPFSMFLVNKKKHLNALDSACNLPGSAAFSGHGISDKLGPYLWGGFPLLFSVICFLFCIIRFRSSQTIWGKKNAEFAQWTRRKKKEKTVEGSTSTQTRMSFPRCVVPEVVTATWRQTEY